MQQSPVSTEEAKRDWLERLDTTSRSNSVKMRLDQAKMAWLAELDARSWDKAATAFASVTSEAAQMAEMTADCYQGDMVACDNLSREQEAKRAWLAKLDVPTWGAAAAAVSAVALEVSAISSSSAEDIAKQAWLAKQDTPSWGNDATRRETPAAAAAPSQGKLTEEEA